MGITAVGLYTGYYDTAMYIGNVGRGVLNRAVSAGDLIGARMQGVNAVGKAQSQDSPLAPIDKVPEVYSNAQTERVFKTPEEMQHDREVAMAILQGKSPRDAKNLNPQLEKMIEEQLGKTGTTQEGEAGLGVQDGGVEEVQDAECETCKNRKYVDGSNEGNVSFKSAQHIAPQSAASAVLSHEYEHVRNAMREDQKEDAELVSVSVSLKTAICPECGKSYVAGGETRTTMRYSQGGESATQPVKNNADAA